MTKEYAKTHRRFGWTLLLLALGFGVTLEVFLGFKAQRYVLDPIRRELWALAHFHGALLAVVNLVYVPWADRAEVAPRRRQAASRALLAGSALLPAGFLLGGIGHPEGDPSFAIWLVPPGAALVLYAAAIQAWSAWRDR